MRKIDQARSIEGKISDFGKKRFGTVPLIIPFFYQTPMVILAFKMDQIALWSEGTFIGFPGKMAGQHGQFFPNGLILKLF